MTAFETGSAFTSVLVANRGEIACRIIRTLRRLGIRSVAVYSDADRDALHVTMADDAVRIGPASARESYLNVEAIVAAATESGAQAVHPGYGFLSESAGLARACADAGIVFVGPGVDALELMGDKIRAKEHVAARGVPVIPGSSGAGLDDAALIAAAENVGFPLLVKPSAGGGGKGMHVVERASDLADTLVAARRVAAAAFGDDTLLLERLITTPRHIEVQVLADNHGNVIHLGERECSLQRRHQKVIEEAPSPLLDAATRERMGEAACDVARSVAYSGAGTIEFLVSADAPDEFFFMEMNTRLQVEHPVTELVATVGGVRGLDLVEWQVRVAAGEPLTLVQADISLTGHAIEARVYAEDPARGFLPATGTVLALAEPTGDGVRVDSSLGEGLRVTSDYDPMLSKVIVWGANRAQALARLDRALAETTVLGVPTNIAFLRRLLAEPAVRAGDLDTGLIERALPGMDFQATDAAALAEAAIIFHADGVAPAPWHSKSGWRVGAHRPAEYVLDVGVARQRVTIDDATVSPAAPVRRVARPFTVARDGDTVWLGREGASVAVRRVRREELLAETLAAIDRPEGEAAPEVRSPMPGTVVAVHVSTGDVVAVGQALLAVEAMKMEHKLTAPVAGTVHLRITAGELVKVDQLLASITTIDTADTADTADTPDTADTAETEEKR